MHVQISDFGLCRRVLAGDEQGEKGAHESPLNNLRLAVKWMAPESLQQREFSTMSDVWSFGVLMYEVFGMGRQAPYAHVTLSSMLTYLLEGSRLEQPPYASDNVYATLLSLRVLSRPCAHCSLADTR